MNAKMNFEQFMETVKNEIKQIAGEEYHITISSVPITDGKYDNICHRDVVGTPAIYLEDYYKEYQNGREIPYIAKKILALALGHQIDINVFAQNIRDYGWVRPRLRVKLINYERNIKLLRTVPHERMLDLAIIPYLLISRNDRIMSMTVNDYLLSGWGIASDEMLRVAKENTLVMEPIIVEKMTDYIVHMIFQELNSMDVEDTANDREALIKEIITKNTGHYEIYIMTNQDNRHGAFAAFQVNNLSNIADKIGVDRLYLVPSSIHEIIAISECGIKAEMLKEMVMSVNETEVTEEEILSNMLYIYDRCRNNISIIC